MQVYIEKNNNNEFHNLNTYQAYSGFLKLGFHTTFFNDIELQEIDRNIPIVGFISTLKKALDRLDVIPETLDYPQCLEPYYGRKIWQTTLNSIKEEDYPIFIKPFSQKLFDGRLLTKFSDLIGVRYDSENDCKIWASSPIKIVTEYRCFVRYGEILDIRKYKGNPFKHLNEDFVNECIKSYVSKPNAFCIDFCITEKGDTYVVEVNDAFSLGCYGLNDILYAKLIYARWCELVGIEDYLK